MRVDKYLLVATGTIEEVGRIHKYYFENMYDSKYFEAGYLTFEVGCLIMIILSHAVSN